MTARLASLSLLALLLALVPGLARAQTPPAGGDTSLAPPPPGNTELAPPPPGDAAPPAGTGQTAWPAHSTTPVTDAPAPTPAPATAHTYGEGQSYSQPGGMTSAQAADLLEAQRRRKIHLISVELTGGGHWIDMETVSSSNFLPPTTTKTSGVGGDGGVAVALRPLDFLSVGARGSLGFFPGYNFGIAAAEVSLILTTQVIEAYLRAGLGYAWVGSADWMDPRLSATNIYGLAVTSSLGLDIYLSDAFSLGAAFDVDFMNLARQVPSTGTPGMVAMVDLSKSGNAVGIHVGGHIALGLHFF